MRVNGLRKISKSKAIILMAVAFVTLIIIAINTGTSNINILSLIHQTIVGEHSDKYATHVYILTNVRLPRICLCIITALSMGICGCIMQNLLRNPLAEPFTLGVSSGASFGAALAIVLGVSIFGSSFSMGSYATIALNSFVFGCISLIIVIAVSKLCNNSITILILTGTAVGSLFSAGISILKYISSAEALQNLDVWLMGGFWGASWEAVLICAPFLAIIFLFMLRFAWDFNSLNAGEDVAATLGVNVRSLKRISLILVTLISSLSIAFCGVIGFVGLVAPHIARSLLGVDNRYLIPGSALIGGIMLLGSDILARTVISPEEIPVGIITSIIGVPFFILILVKKKKQLWRD